MELFEYEGKKYVRQKYRNGKPSFGDRCVGCAFSADGRACGLNAPCGGGIMVEVEESPAPCKPLTYQQLCVKTCADVPHILLNQQKTDLLHAAMGISTEAGELLDNLKKVFYYGKTFDEVNFKEELGDVLWYIGMVCERMGWQMDDIMATNIAKLKVRYPEKFTEEAAERRDLESERAVLEGALVADDKDPSVHVNPPIVSVADAEAHELWCGAC